MKQVYPTFIVNTEDNPVHPFWVCVPDLDILTEGDSLFNAIEMARDAIGVAGITLEDRNTEIPTPSEQGTALEKVMKYSDEVDFSKGILTYVDIDFMEYRRKIDSENPIKAEKLKERLESFYGRPIDEIHMELDGTNSYDKKQKAYRELVKIVNSRTTKSTITDDKAEWLSYLDERYMGEKTDVPVCDIHMHVIPGVDDGSESMEMSLAMLRSAYIQGVRTVFCTSHGGVFLTRKKAIRQEKALMNF